MIQRIKKINKKCEHFLTKENKMAPILFIKLRIVRNNIFISFVLKNNGEEIKILKQYSLKKSKLFKNKLLLTSFLLNEMLKISISSFFIEYPELVFYRLGIQIYYFNIVPSFFFNFIKYFNNFNIFSIEFFLCRSHNGCRRKKIQRKKTAYLSL